ncbi:hypothetical protein NDU88_004689 [Pleurodeles waltl]|uniref:Uncharacterized protein n=1 Tax=Pleurodeles waltl TaxID=8319 RepID=A0AAV7LM37_PLEWA|nr:hypothetical protein NDU88_004689 [Pleurodeles waltl]
MRPTWRKSPSRAGVLMRWSGGFLTALQRVHFLLSPFTSPHWSQLQLRCLRRLRQPSPVAHCSDAPVRGKQALPSATWMGKGCDESAALSALTLPSFHPQLGYT